MTLILHGDHVVTMNPNGAVLLDSRGRIQAVGEASAVLDAHPAVEVKRLEDRLLMPGLVNTHAPYGLLRGMAEGLPVRDWLQNTSIRSAM